MTLIKGLDVYEKMKAAREVIDQLQAFILTYESQVEQKESELRVLEKKIETRREENAASESKASLILAKANEEGAMVRRTAQELLEQARTASVQAKKEKQDALDAIAEAKARSLKLESDEKAFSAQVIIFERKRTALEQAMHVG